MKKLSTFLLICFAFVQTIFATSWGSYPTTNSPGLSDTFLIGNFSGPGTNLQVSASNLRTWILLPTTNAIIWTNAFVPGKALVVVGVTASGGPIVAATNWPTGSGSGDMIGANNLLDVASISAARANLGANDAGNLTIGTLDITRLPRNGIITNLNAITNLIGGSNVTVSITVAPDGAKSVTIQGITTPQFLTFVINLALMTNGGGQTWTNTTFTANGLLYAGANKQILSVNVGPGAITNDGSGNFGAAMLRDSSALGNNSFAFADNTGKIISGNDGSSLSNLIGGPIITGDSTVTVTATRITSGKAAGSTNYALHATGGGGGALGSTNYFLSTTNAFLFDCAVNQRADLGVLTNFNLTFTNVGYLTNTSAQSFQINLHNPTNGPWTLQSMLNAGGLVITNNGNVYDTNLNAQTRLIGRLDWSLTNVELSIDTNWFPKYAFTNSSQGGGGGGGAAWTLIDHKAVAASGSVSTLTVSGLNTVGANLVVFIGVNSGGSTAVGTTSPSDTVGASTTYVANSPKVQFFYVLAPSQTASYSVTVGVGGNSIDSVQAFSFNKSGGSPTFDTESAGARTANWGGSGTIAGGSGTPATTSDLIFTAVAWDVFTTTSATVSSSFIVSPDGVLTHTYKAVSAYKIKSDGTAENPAWMPSPSSNADADTSTWFVQ